MTVLAQSSQKWMKSAPAVGRVGMRLKGEGRYIYIDR